jgi:hypothetical protein
MDLNCATGSWKAVPPLPTSLYSVRAVAPLLFDVALLCSGSRSAPVRRRSTLFGQSLRSCSTLLYSVRAVAPLLFDVALLLFGSRGFPSVICCSL